MSSGVERLWRRVLCRLGQHEGHVDGGFHCDYCTFEIPYVHDDAQVARWAELSAQRPMQLKAAWHLEQWQKDAILEAWRTGRPVIAKRPDSKDAGCRCSRRNARYASRRRGEPMTSTVRGSGGRMIAALFRSPRLIDSTCVIHGRGIESDGLCPECREQNALTNGDYLWAHGVLRDGDSPHD